jgi:nitrogen fixation-related uncharacterized protein
MKLILTILLLTSPALAYDDEYWLRDAERINRENEETHRGWQRDRERQERVEREERQIELLEQQNFYMMNQQFEDSLRDERRKKDNW